MSNIGFPCFRRKFGDQPSLRAVDFRLGERERGKSAAAVSGHYYYLRRPISFLISAITSLFLISFLSPTLDEKM
jgi:hypothetical protein